MSSSISGRMTDRCLTPEAAGNVEFNVKLGVERKVSTNPSKIGIPLSYLHETLQPRVAQKVISSLGNRKVSRIFDSEQKLIRLGSMGMFVGGSNFGKRKVKVL